MAYDLQEQDQLDAFKAFWKQFGTPLMVGLVAALLAFGGWRAWTAYQQKQANEAAALYGQLREAAQAKHLDEVKRTATALSEHYGRTVYGVMGALVAAQSHLDSGDSAAAKDALRWAIEKGSEPALSKVARLRLAGLLLDEKAYDDGLRLLTGIDAGSFEPLFADRRGDLLHASGRSEEAKAAYRAALDRLETNAALRPWVQLKLDALGGV